ncbi:hypothetical protein IGI04_024208 [Brassica rapa subsp. trilocularis]|uniref:HPt domain-containing protein n=1 Tax=Brassica rapa subsp. trilocularis TaxID=1813537 RepID=A0ABQ7M623_BRACM|nr:hypothetical protein IGI04_024208 [Brassica rapa subsp. trilocularis]
MTLEQPLKDVPRAAELTEVKKAVHKLKGSLNDRASMLEVQIKGLTAKRDVDLRSASYEAKEVFIVSYIGYLAQ